MIAKNKSGRTKLVTRLDASLAVIEKALVDAGVKLDPSEAAPYARYLRIKAEKGAAPGIKIEGMIPGWVSFDRSEPNGDEPLVIKIGGHGGVKIRSAKEDPDLTGVRVPKIVAAILEAIERFAHEKALCKRKYTNEESSFKIAERCGQLLPHNGPVRFGATEAHADMIVFGVRDTFVTEDEAQALAAALGPVLAKIQARKDPA